MPTGLIGTIIVGGIIGWLASILGKTSNQMGCLWNIAVGIVGASLGHWIASRFLHFNVAEGFSITGFAIGIGGALLLVLALRGIGILRSNK